MFLLVINKVKRSRLLHLHIGELMVNAKILGDIRRVINVKYCCQIDYKRIKPVDVSSNFSNFTL